MDAMISEVKKDFHILIDQIDNEEVLKSFYKVMLQSTSRKEGELYNSLSEEQKKALLLAEEQSKYSENLIDHETQIKKYKNWL